MHENWINIKGFMHAYQAEIAQAVLNEHDIMAILVNKQDSAYTHIGLIELYVHRDNALRAAHILREW